MENKGALAYLILQAYRGREKKFEGFVQDAKDAWHALNSLTKDDEGSN